MTMTRYTIHSTDNIHNAPVEKAQPSFPELWLQAFAVFIFLNNRNYERRWRTATKKPYSTLTN